jgi:hypothetical protein
MRKLLLIFVAMFAFASAVRAQSVVFIGDTLKARFVRLTVEDFFSYWGKIYPNSIPKHTITLITDIDAKLLPDTVVGLPIKVLANEKLLHKRKNRVLTKERIYKVQLIVPDSNTIMIDVNLVVWDVSFEGRRMEIIAHCGGDLGYIPDGRFVYDEKENRWKASFHEELLNQRAKEVNAMFHSRAEPTTKDAPISDTAAKGMLIIYHDNSSLPPDTIITNRRGVETMNIYHGSEIDYPDMQEMKIEGVEVKVKY